MNIGTSHETVLTHYQQDYIGYDNGFGGIVWVLFSLCREVNPAPHSYDILGATILCSRMVGSLFSTNQVTRLSHAARHPMIISFKYEITDAVPFSKDDKRLLSYDHCTVSQSRSL